MKNISRRNCRLGLATQKARPVTSWWHGYSNRCQPWRMLLAIFSLVTGTAWAETNRISAENLSVQLSGQEGRIIAATLGGKQGDRPLRAYTELVGCEQSGPVERRVADGRIDFIRKLVHAKTKDECTVTERFLPGKASIRWEVEISGAGEPWSTAIETHFVWPNHQFPVNTWMAESGETGPIPPLHFVTNHRSGQVLEWNDPLLPQPIRERQVGYGGGSSKPGFCIPLVTLMEEQGDRGLTLALSPDDVPCSLNFRSTADGHMVFSRTNLRISKDRPVRLAMDLVAHEGDWRAALGWMVERYPEYFNPPNPKAALIAGCGAFCSSYAGDLDADKMKAMGAGVNWGYGFTFPYVGMYLPYVKEGEEWVSFEGRKESTRTLDRLAEKWQAAGIQTLAEFVTTEWGYKTLDGNRIPTADARMEKVDAASFRDGDSWKDTTDFLNKKLPGTVLFDENDKIVFSQLDIPKSNVVTDPGEPVFAEFLEDQTRRFVREVPHCAGICIDRMDWLEWYNPRRDDGVSWVNGKSARSLRVSWLQITERLGRVLHEANKSIFVNSHIKRLDLMRHVDGIFDEYGYLPFNNNATALLGLRKSVIGWTPGEDYLKQDPDAFFQRHLYLGIFPMAPFPENSTPVEWLHSIQPGEWAETQYKTYGPLLDLNRGKKWVLEAHAVEVRDRAAKANLFEVPAGHVIPVVFGGDRAKVTVILRKLNGFPKNPVFEARHPGADSWVPVVATEDGDRLRLVVPLMRGCAMVKITSKSQNHNQRTR